MSEFGADMSSCAEKCGNCEADFYAPCQTCNTKKVCIHCILKDAHEPHGIIAYKIHCKDCAVVRCDLCPTEKSEKDIKKTNVCVCPKHEEIVKQNPYSHNVFCLQHLGHCGRLLTTCPGPKCVNCLVVVNCKDCHDPRTREHYSSVEYLMHTDDIYAKESFLRCKDCPANLTCQRCKAVVCRNGRHLKKSSDGKSYFCKDCFWLIETHAPTPNFKVLQNFKIWQKIL